MTLNASGAISLGGSTVGESINLELDLSATAQASIDSAPFRTLAGVSSGQIGLSNFYGKSNLPPYFLSTISTGDTNRDLFSIDSTVGSSGSTIVVSKENGGYIWVTKLDASMAHVWSFRFTGDTNWILAGRENDIIEDSSGNIFLAGVGGYYVKLNSAGAVQFSYYFSVANLNTAYARCHLDNAGNLYYVGYNTSQNKSTISKINNNGTVAWSEVIGFGAYSLSGTLLAFDSSNNPYGTMYFYGNAINTANFMCVLFKLNPSTGAVVFAKGYPQTGTVQGYNSGGYLNLLLSTGPLVTSSGDIFSGSVAFNYQSGVNSGQGVASFHANGELQTLSSNTTMTSNPMLSVAGPGSAYNASYGGTFSNTGVYVDKGGAIDLSDFGGSGGVVVKCDRSNSLLVTNPPSYSADNGMRWAVGRFPITPSFFTYLIDGPTSANVTSPTIIASKASITATMNLVSSIASSNSWTASVDTALANVSSLTSYNLAPAANTITLSSVATSNLTSGSSLYVTAGTYSWIAPAGVTNVSAVAIGGGAGSSVGQTFLGYGGGGGGLGWKNGISVVPANTYTVVVGSAGAAQSSYFSYQAATPQSGTSGTNSYFISTGTVAGYGVGIGVDPGGNYVGDGGGYGGGTNNHGGGGGAGGYAGNGGRAGRSSPYWGGQPATAGNGGGGGGGGAAPSPDYGPAYPGGGVSVFGRGANGDAGAITYSSAAGRGRPGSYGSGSKFGGGGGMGQYFYEPPANPESGGYNVFSAGYAGTSGAVRILWPSTTRAFPSANTFGP